MLTDSFVVRVGAAITEEREVRRQMQSFRVDLCCPTPALRDAAQNVANASNQRIEIRYGADRILVRDALTSAQAVALAAAIWERLGDSGPDRRDPGLPEKCRHQMAGCQGIP